MEQRIIKTDAKEIFTKTNLPGADYVINQYVGCSHNCSYCYARFMARWKGYGGWGTWLEAKMNAPELVKGRQVKGQVFMSSVSDAYQSTEKDLELTRRILDNLNKSTQLSILTKSNLVLRDMDLLKEFENVEVGFTINSFEGKKKELFEHNSPTNNERIETMKILKENGIKTFAFISPIIPGLIDIEEIIGQTKEIADYYWFEAINLRGAGKEFTEILETNYPESLRLVRDKHLFADYIESLRKKVVRSGIKTKGIEIH